MTLQYVVPTDEVVILVHNLSEWQQDFLNNTLEFRDFDRIGSDSEGVVYRKLCYGQFVDGSRSWIMINHSTDYPVIHFNDIFIEE